MNPDLILKWVGESQGRTLYRIYNEQDYSHNLAIVPLGTMSVDKQTQNTVVVWERHHTETRHTGTY